MSQCVRALLSIFLLISFIWYFHEYHNPKFREISSAIPYLNEVGVSLHSLFKRYNHVNKQVENGKLFTKDELLHYNGESGSLGLYIAILGKVYDVEKGSKHYDKNGGYHIFAGKDGSRAFITGDFTPSGATDEVNDLTPKELISLKEWSGFYDKEYIYKGKVIGKFYNDKGEETEYYKEFEKKILQGKTEKENEQNEKLQFPPCNMEWSKDSGSRVWCTTKSGGIDRDWVGVPRKLFEVGSDKHRCACINLDDLNNPSSSVYSKRGLLKQYDGCGKISTSCITT